MDTKLTKELIDKIAHLTHDEGLSPDAIAERLNLNSWEVVKILLFDNKPSEEIESPSPSPSSSPFPEPPKTSKPSEASESSESSESPVSPESLALESSKISEVPSTTSSYKVSNYPQLFRQELTLAQNKDKEAKGDEDKGEQSNPITAAYLQQKYVPKDKKGNYLYSLRYCSRLMERIQLEIALDGLKEPSALPNLELTTIQGEAQVGFGTADVIINGQECEIATLIMVFPYSDRKLIYPLPAPTFECLAVGLQSMFRLIHGVPKVIFFNKMSAITKDSPDTDADIFVDANGTKRYLTENFRRFMRTYKFDVEFCRSDLKNVALESTKQTVKRSYFVGDAMFVTGKNLIEVFRRLCNIVWTRLDVITEQKHPRFKAFTVQQLFEQEQKQLLPLSPELAKNPINWVNWQPISIVVDTKGRVWADGNLYQTKLAPNTVVKVGLSWTHVYVHHQGTTTCLAERKYNLNDRFVDWPEQVRICKLYPYVLRKTCLYQVLPKNLRDYLTSIPRTELSYILSNMYILVSYRDIYSVMALMDEFLAKNKDSSFSFNDFVPRMYDFVCQQLKL